MNEINYYYIIQYNEKLPSDILINKTYYDTYIIVSNIKI